MVIIVPANISKFLLPSHKHVVMLLIHTGLATPGITIQFQVNRKLCFSNPWELDLFKLKTKKLIHFTIYKHAFSSPLLSPNPNLFKKTNCKRAKRSYFYFFADNLIFRLTSK